LLVFGVVKFCGVAKEESTGEPSINRNH
jgi:hypothetical protein